jgi:transcriptional regulator with XRE-family HTH domain
MLSLIVKKTRTQQHLTQDGFAEALCEQLPGVNLTKQAISNWERGAQTPDYMFLIAVLMTYKDWRFDFAHQCLQALRPRVWADEVPSTTE